MLKQRGDVNRRKEEMLIEADSRIIPVLQHIQLAHLNRLYGSSSATVLLHQRWCVKQCKTNSVNTCFIRMYFPIRVYNWTRVDPFHSSSLSLKDNSGVFESFGFYTYYQWNSCFTTRFEARSILERGCTIHEPISPKNDPVFNLVISVPPVNKFVAIQKTLVNFTETWSIPSPKQMVLNKRGLWYCFRKVSKVFCFISHLLVWKCDKLKTGEIMPKCRESGTAHSEENRSVRQLYTECIVDTRRN